MFESTDTFVRLLTHRTFHLSKQVWTQTGIVRRFVLNVFALLENKLMWYLTAIDIW